MNINEIWLREKNFDVIVENQKMPAGKKGLLLKEYLGEDNWLCGLLTPLSSMISIQLAFKELEPEKITEAHLDYLEKLKDLQKQGYTHTCSKDQQILGEEIINDYLRTDSEIIKIY